MKTIVISFSEWRLKIRLGIHANSSALANLDIRLDVQHCQHIEENGIEPAPERRTHPMVDVSEGSLGVSTATDF